MPLNAQEINQKLAILQASEQDKIDLQKVLGIGEQKDTIIFYDDPAYPRIRKKIQSLFTSTAGDKNAIAQALFDLASSSKRTVRWDFFDAARDLSTDQNLKFKIYSEYKPSVKKIKSEDLTLDKAFYYFFITGFNHNESKAKRIFTAIELGQGQHPEEEPIAKLINLVFYGMRDGKEVHNKTREQVESAFKEAIDTLLIAKDILDEKKQHQLISLLNLSPDAKKYFVAAVIRAGRASEVLATDNLLIDWLRTPKQYFQFGLIFAPSRNHDKKVTMEDTQEFQKLRDSVKSVQLTEVKSSPKKESVVAPAAPTPTPTFTLPTGWKSSAPSANETIVTKTDDEKQKFVVNHENGKISTNQNSLEVFQAMMQTYKNTHPTGKIPTMSVSGKNPEAYLNMLKAFKECYPNELLTGKMRGDQNQWKKALETLHQSSDESAFAPRGYTR